MKLSEQLRFLRDIQAQQRKSAAMTAELERSFQHEMMKAVVAKYPDSGEWSVHGGGYAVWMDADRTEESKLMGRGDTILLAWENTYFNYRHMIEANGEKDEDTKPVRT